jgi:2-succinyl-6-hydroxy-2,4-cyclohexadiene-1-carboxylate synthase
VIERRVAANGIALQVRDEEGRGDPLVLLHFSGANLLMWEPALPHFRDAFRVIRLDLRGHGRSDAPDTGYHMDTMARDVVGALAALGIGRAHVVGSSMGAEVALAMAANHPEAVASLVLDGALYEENGPHGAWEGTDDEYRDHVARQLEALRSRPETVFPSLDALVEASRRSLEPLGWWNADVAAMER